MREEIADQGVMDDEGSAHSRSRWLFGRFRSSRNDRPPSDTAQTSHTSATIISIPAGCGTLIRSRTSV
jgi:hypothetical protein